MIWGKILNLTTRQYDRNDDHTFKFGPKILRKRDHIFKLLLLVILKFPFKPCHYHRQ